MATTSTSPNKPLLDTLAEHSAQIGYVTLGIAAALTAIPIVAGVRSGAAAMPTILWGVFLATFTALAGLLYLNAGSSTAIRGVDRLRMLLLALAGGAGL